MVFLGKYMFQHGDKYLALVRDNKLQMVSLSPNDPAGVFLAYQHGQDQFSLQASNGQWVTINTLIKEDAWYPVLTYIGTGTYPNRFHLPFLDWKAHTVRFAWIEPEESRKVSLQISGYNANCGCYFNVGVGWDKAYGTTFSCVTLAPGVPEIQLSRTAINGDFSCVGKACVDISGESLSGVNFQGAKFKGANLAGTIFAGANLTDADLSSLELPRVIINDQTDFQGAVLKGTNFSGLDLSNNKNFSRPPDFSRDANDRTKFIKSSIDYSLIGLNWSYLDLTDARILNVPKDLTGLFAREALLKGVNLGAEEGEPPYKLEEADFTDAEMTGARLKRATLIMSRLDGAHLHGAVLADVELTSCSMVEAKLGEDETHQAASLAGAKIRQTDFSGADLVGVNFEKTEIGYQTKFDGAKLMRVSFERADLGGSMLRGNRLEGANFRWANLTNCDLSGAKLRPDNGDPQGLVEGSGTPASPEEGGSGAEAGDEKRSQLEGACLLGTNFTNAELQGADLVNAVLAFEPGKLYRPDSQPLPYEPTILSEQSTDQSSRCPADVVGPCAGDKLVFASLPSNMTEVKNAEGKLLGYSWKRSADGD